MKQRQSFVLLYSLFLIFQNVTRHTVACRLPMVVALIFRRKNVDHNNTATISRVCRLDGGVNKTFSFAECTVFILFCSARRNIFIEQTTFYKYRHKSTFVLNFMRDDEEHYCLSSVQILHYFTKWKVFSSDFLSFGVCYVCALFMTTYK
jgi:hypothetical protein